MNIRGLTFLLLLSIIVCGCTEEQTTQADSNPKTGSEPSADGETTPSTQTTQVAHSVVDAAQTTSSIPQSPSTFPSTSSTAAIPPVDDVTSDSQDLPETTSSTHTTSTTYTSSTTTSTTQSNEAFVLAPKEGCECMQWVCPTVSVTTSSTVSSTTSTTCVEVTIPSYSSQTRHYNVIMRGQKFKPDLMNAFLGDTIIANITNKQGLHRIRETYSNRTIMILPETTYELIFYALEKGEHLLTCNPFCEEPMEAKIVVEEPYELICE